MDVCFYYPPHTGGGGELRAIAPHAGPTADGGRGHAADGGMLGATAVTAAPVEAATDAAEGWEAEAVPGRPLSARGWPALLALSAGGHLSLLA